MREARIIRTAHGRGLAAARDLGPGTVVARFTGRLVPHSELPEHEVRHALWWDDERSMIPDPPARWLNHGCVPSCAIRADPDPAAESCEVVALRPLAAGEELTISYDQVDPAALAPGRRLADYPWDPRWSFRCGCAAAACRGTIDRYVLAAR